MIIRKIGLENFRQFLGSQEIELSTATDRNVTLVHAENGFGKTTLLNAVFWTLFERTTSKFERPDDIINYESLRDHNSYARVSVDFLHENSRYLAERTFDREKPAHARSTFGIFNVDETGHHKKIDSPDTFIRTVIPAEMAKYFFFDGEAAETFTTAKNFKAISEAIKNILGSTLAKTAVEDLKEIEKAIGKHLTQIPGEEKLSGYEREILSMQEKADSYSVQIVGFEDEAAELTSLVEDLNERLVNSAGAKELQQRRNDKEQQLSRTKNEIEEINRDLVNWIGRRGISVVSKKLAQISLDFIDEESLKGRIPSPYNEEFVRSLLQSEECICHRPLVPESPEWRAVSSLLSNAANAETLRRVINARGRTNTLRQEASEAPTELKRLRSKLAEKITVREGLEHEIGELGQKIEEIDLSEIQELEVGRRKALQRIRDLDQKIGQYKMAVGSFVKRKKELEKEQQSMVVQNKKARQFLIRKRVLERAQELVTALLAQHEEEARSTIESDISTILEAVAHRSYRCKIEPNFSIDLMYEDGKSVPRSGGENQLLSLLFIGSLVKFAASRIDDDSYILKPGTIAPLILDAPFGQLDPYYQQDVASYIPKLAQQVVLLVSSSQGNEAVLKALEPYVGAEYMLVSENREAKGTKKVTRLNLHGKEYVTSFYGQNKTMTRIERIR